jgi:ribose/xylose/arabinose/galactoside ABC-type transport system permease subunit
MAIAGASSYWQRVITGMVLFAVVVFDSLSKKRKNA